MLLRYEIVKNLLENWPGFLPDLPPNLPDLPELPPHIKDGFAIGLFTSVSFCRQMICETVPYSLFYIAIFRKTLRMTAFSESTEVEQTALFLVTLKNGDAKSKTCHRI